MTDQRLISGRPTRKGLIIAAAAVVGALAVGLGLGLGFGPNRQQIVAERGASVMPFDLDATTHIFDPTQTGGTQTVVAKDSADQVQIDLIRGHLEKEAAAFERGEFRDPEEIHGEDMPGLKELEAGADRMTVTYSERIDGAQLVFETTDVALIKALHDWFAAQRSDHGGHAN
jgi:hypothetical protein